MFTLTTLLALAAAGVAAVSVPLSFRGRFMAGVIAFVVAIMLVALVKALLGIIAVILLIALAAFLASCIASKAQPTSPFDSSRRGKL